MSILNISKNKSEIAEHYNNLAKQAADEASKKKAVKHYTKMANDSKTLDL